MDKYQAMMLYCLAGLVVKDTGEVLENFLRDASKWADSIVVPPRAKGPSTAKEIGKNEALEADIEEIYAAYPPRCPKRQQSTGKCAKDKDRIRILLTKKGKSKSDILAAIEQTISDGGYLKNFSTFLNNLPEIADHGEDNITGTIWQ